MNPVDHPHGGGEGRTSGGRHPVHAVGQARPRATRRARNPRTDKYIVRRREEEAMEARWRSIKKGPFIDDQPAEARSRSLNCEDGQEGDQDLVAALDDHASRWSADVRTCTTARSSFRSTSPRTWSGTSSASSRPTRKFTGHAGQAAQEAEAQWRSRMRRKVIATGKLRYLGVSAQKARLVVDQVRGKQGREALDILHLSARRARRPGEAAQVGRGQRRAEATCRSTSTAVRGARA